MPASSDDSGTGVRCQRGPQGEDAGGVGPQEAGRRQGLHGDNPLREKAHGSEVTGGAAPKMHRRKAGGGGS